jgi:hypothetical protein
MEHKRIGDEVKGWQDRKPSNPFDNKPLSRGKRNKQKSRIKQYYAQQLKSAPVFYFQGLQAPMIFPHVSVQPPIIPVQPSLPLPNSPPPNKRQQHQEAFEEWLCEQTQFMTEKSKEHFIRNLDEMPCDEVLDRCLLRRRFKDFPEDAAHRLNTINKNKHARIELEEFAITETPYERLSRNAQLLRKEEQLKRDRQRQQHNPVPNEAPPSSELQQIEKDSRMRRYVLEEKCYVNILWRRGVRPQEIFDSVDLWWDTGELMIPEAELNEAVEMEHLSELRRVRSME